MDPKTIKIEGLLKSFRTNHAINLHRTQILCDFWAMEAEGLSRFHASNEVFSLSSSLLVADLTRRAFHEIAGGTRQHPPYSSIQAQLCTSHGVDYDAG